MFLCISYGTANRLLQPPEHQKSHAGQVAEQKHGLVVLVKFIDPLQKGKTAQQTPEPVNDHGLVVRCRESLKGAHGIEGIIILASLFKHGVIRRAAPGLARYGLGKIPVHSIAMGKTPVADSGQAVADPAAAGSYTAQEKGVPPGHGGQILAGGRQRPHTESAKKDIILKKQDRLCSGTKALVQAMDMGLKNSLFPVFRMRVDQDKFHSLQQTNTGKLLFCLSAPICPFMQGDTVNPVEKIPASLLVAAALMHLSKPFSLARGPGYRVEYKIIHFVPEFLLPERTDDPTIYPTACQ